jgi:hypothetical protein
MRHMRVESIDDREERIARWKLRNPPHSLAFSGTRGAGHATAKLLVRYPLRKHSRNLLIN